MGPLESFLRSINCYPEHDQNRRKESPSKERKKHSTTSHSTKYNNNNNNNAIPLMQTTSPPPLSDNIDVCIQPSSSTGFSWTPSLLSQQRKASKNNRQQNDLSLPEKERKDRSDNNQPHSA